MTNSKSAGFTLIELVIVIVILGVLAAVAAPRFIDLSEDAESSALQAQASAITSASAINFAAAATRGRDASDEDVEEVTECNDETVGRLLEGGLDTERYEVVSGSFDEQEFGSRATCELEALNSSVENRDFTLIYVGNGG
ncbi:type II secretion system protein [Aquisalimonas sp. 2447]|uniref:type II secretion system protein n=1 Tax=Aquisalimonas sp. 2447 TaxID=2740807 RepID=UPI0014327940|nr:type II secretion system protein [Aquisalimonas sp. 2447]QIT55550.1 type II secretion system protein [Aquisalimonas sp. 2447]